MRVFVTVDARSVKTHSVNWEKAFRYAQQLSAGACFPPPRATKLHTGQFLIKNGAHRTYAHRLIGKPMKIQVAS